jgi:long-chain acyl-CoA synthetase
MAATSPHQGRPTGEETSSATDCWVFDVDGCLVDSLTGTSLRPGARELLDSLADRARVLLWSAGGDTYARARAEQFQVDHLVNGYFSKEGRDGGGHYLTTHLPLGPGHVVFVDDKPEDLAEDLDVLPVSPYLSDDPHDRGLRVVTRRAGLPPSPEG